MPDSRRNLLFLIVGLAIALSTHPLSGMEKSGQAVDDDGRHMLAEMVQQIITYSNSTESRKRSSRGTTSPKRPPTFGADPREVSPPPGASDPGPGQELIVEHRPRRSRIKRDVGIPETIPRGNYESNTLTKRNKQGSWYRLGFSSGSFVPEPGLDPRLLAKAVELRSRDRSEVFGFLLMDEYICEETKPELKTLGVEVLGPHSTAYKVRLPVDPALLNKIVSLPYVKWLGLSQRAQKIDPELTRMMEEELSPDGRYPVYVNLFVEDGDGDLKDQLSSFGAIVGKYDPGLMMYSAVITGDILDALLDLDFVLAVEPIHPIELHHDQSMPLVGADYIRPGGYGSNFDGSPVILGILDSGFMMGRDSHAMHEDLDKNCCGINFTDDAAWVWNDEDGHGTHVVATAIGTGTANPMYRGFAPGVGSSETTMVRAAKVTDSVGHGSSEDIELAIDYMGEPWSCASYRPDIVHMSLGKKMFGFGGTGPDLSGTDATSRKLDQMVWEHQQLYVVSAGNNGPDQGTVGSPAVAKNAFAVGNVVDFDDFVSRMPGDIWDTSSRGPTGDGRMKPNLVAPGCVITSAKAGTTDEYTNSIAGVLTCGTSMAAPHVTGLAATLLHHQPTFRWRPYLTKAMLMATSLAHRNDTFPTANNAGGVYRTAYGLGRISTYVAHWARDNPQGWTTHWYWHPNLPGDAVGYREVDVPVGSDRLTVVLTWDEPPPSAKADAAVIDNIDLWVDHFGDCTDETYPGGCGEYASVSTTDNVEYLIINNPPPGVYRLKAAPKSVSEPRPVAIAAVIVRGDTNPIPEVQTEVEIRSVSGDLVANVTSTISCPSWVCSAIQMTDIGSGGGLAIGDTWVQGEDGVTLVHNQVTGVTIGNIHEGDSRTVRWRRYVLSEDLTSLDFRLWSENSGQQEFSVTVDPSTFDPSLIFEDGFEPFGLSEWSSAVGQTEGP